MLRNIINFDELMALIKGIADNAATTPEDAAKIARTKITSLRVDGQGGHTMPVMWQAGGDVEIIEVVVSGCALYNPSPKDKIAISLNNTELINTFIKLEPQTIPVNTKLYNGNFFVALINTARFRPVTIDIHYKQLQSNDVSEV